MACNIRITVKGTAQLDYVVFSRDGNEIELDWARTEGFSKFCFENYSVQETFLSFGLEVGGFHRAKYTYTIERWNAGQWIPVDKDTFEIDHSGIHSFEKTIDLFKGADGNAQIKPVIV